MSQQMDALRVANEIRLTRAAWKREIAELPMHEGAGLVADLILATPPEFESMRVAEALRAPRMFGVGKARTACRKAAVGELRKLGTLTPRERARLAAQLHREPVDDPPPESRLVRYQRIVCPACGDTFEARPSAKRVYCSRTCQTLTQRAAFS